MKNKLNIVVTGANSGIGKYLCANLTGKNYRVIGISKSINNLVELKSRLKGSFDYRQINIKNFARVKEIFDEVFLTYKRIDVLINNAAVFYMGTFLEQSVDSINDLVDTNLKGVIYCTRAVLEQMIKAGGGKIINISSVSGIRGIEGQAVYSSTKHALMGFADSINQEIIKKGVQINTICPGGVNTELWNERNNPYPGDVNALLDPKHVTDIIEFIIKQPQKLIFKQTVFFPNVEWH